MIDKIKSLLICLVLFALFIFLSLTLFAKVSETKDQLGYGADEYTMLTASSDYTTSTPVLVNDFPNVDITMAAVSASGTLQFIGSNQVDVDFDAAASATNRYDFIEVIDLENGNAIDGDTGIPLANTTDDRQYEANTNIFRYIGALLTNYTGTGTTTLYLKPANNR